MIVQVPSAGQFGMLGDAAPQELPVNAWSSALNVRFRDGYAERVMGLSHATPLTAPAASPWWLQPYSAAGTRYWVHATPFAIYSDDGSTRTNISGAFTPTATVDTRYTGGVLSGVLIINSPADVPQYWTGVGDVAAIPAWDPTWRAKSLRPYKNYLVGLSMTKGADEFRSMVKWSAAAAPGSVPASWDEADPTNDAGEQDIAETNDELVDQVPLGDMNVLYKEESMFGMRYIGGQQIFAFQRLPGEVGAVAPACVAAVPPGHVVLTYGDVILHAGQGPQSILDGRMRRWLRTHLSSDRYKRSFLCINWVMKEVWICIPQQGDESATLALVWNWPSDTFTVRELPGVNYGTHGRMPTSSASEAWDDEALTWDEESDAWDEVDNNASQDRLLLAKDANDILLADEGSADGVAAFSSSLERVGMAFDAPDDLKVATGIRLRIDASPGTVLQVEIGGHMTAEEAPIYSSPVTYTVGTSYKVDSFATGRFLALRITSSAAALWRFKSYGFEFVLRGKY